MEIIFNKNNETEVLHQSSTQDPPNTNKENELDNQCCNIGSVNFVSVGNDSSNNNIQELESITSSGKQLNQVKDHTSGQMGDALAASGKIVEAASSHGTVDCSLTKCVIGLEEIEDISDDIFGKALEKFKDPDWREMFMAMSNDRRRGWLFRL